jgi:hypothetical protein
MPLFQKSLKLPAFYSKLLKISPFAAKNTRLSRNFSQMNKIKIQKDLIS